MSVLDGKQVLTLRGVSYTLQTPPHAAAPLAQNQAFYAALAGNQSGNTVVTTSTSTTLTAAQNGTFVQFKGSTAAQTVTLPAASTASGVSFNIQNLASVTVSLTSTAGNIVGNGVAAGLTHVLTAHTDGANLTSLTVLSDGTGWNILNLEGALTS